MTGRSHAAGQSVSMCICAINPHSHLMRAINISSLIIKGFL